MRYPVLYRTVFKRYRLFPAHRQNLCCRCHAVGSPLTTIKGAKIFILALSDANAWILQYLSHHEQHAMPLLPHKAFRWSCSVPCQDPSMLSEDTGKELLDEMKQEDLRQYNTQQVGRVNAEIQHVECKMDSLKHLAETSGITEELSVNFAMLKAYRERLTRISRAYHMDRLLKIEDNYFVRDDIRKLLCVSEMVFDKDFNRCADDYLLGFKHLSLNDRSPPLSFYVQIQTLEDCGMVLCDDEFIDLKRDRIYFLKKADVAHLLKRRMARII